MESETVPPPSPRRRAPPGPPTARSATRVRAMEMRAGSERRKAAPDGPQGRPRIPGHRRRRAGPSDARPRRGGAALRSVRRRLPPLRAGPAFPSRSGSSSLMSKVG